MEKELKMDRYTKPLLMTCIDMDAIATADPVQWWISPRDYYYYYA